VFVRDRQLGTITRVSLSADGVEGDCGSAPGAMSASGRFVVFNSCASNLVPGDTNGQTDVFLRDRDTDADGVFDEPGAVSTTLVSISSEGKQGNRPAPRRTRLRSVRTDAMSFSNHNRPRWRPGRPITSCTCSFVTPCSGRPCKRL
jgi:hypothetical protein